MSGHVAPSTETAGKRSAFVPQLRLFTEELLVVDGSRGHTRDKAAVLSLRFVYPHGTVRGSSYDEGFGGEEMPSGPVDRDPIAEAQAQRLLEGFGAVEIGCLEHLAAPVGSEADYLVQVDGDVHALCSFSAHAVQRLRQLGWQVEIADDYPYQVIDGAGGWYASIEDGDRPDWFGLELGVEVDGQRINLMPALIALIEHSGAESLERLTRVPARLRALEVAPNRYVTLPPERLARILRVLRELYTGAHAPLGALRFPGAWAPALAELHGAVGEDTRLSWSGHTSVVHRARALAGDPSFFPTPVALRAALRPYQHAGLNWMQHLREHEAGGVLADDMGLGKTLQTIAHLASEKEARRLDRPSLIVVPTSLVGNWQRELRRFTPHLRVAVWHGPNRKRNAPELRRAEVVITTYPLLCRDQDVFEKLELHYLIIDEAQAIKNPRSQAATAVRALSARHRLCLTGTPIENNLEELWSLFHFLMPGMLGTAEQFRQRYRAPIEQAGDSERLEALRERIAPFILRRVKESVAAELPPKTILVRPVELTGDQRDLYESIRIAAHADVRRAIRENTFARSTIAVLDALMKLRQVCCDPRLLTVPAARDVQESAKYEALMTLLERQLAQGRRVLLFSQFTRMLALVSEGLLERGIRHLTLTGQTTDRQARVDAFEQGKADVFLISLKAGGTGLNLVSADTVIHYDPWWNAAAQAQAEDRAYRIGQSRPVFVHNLIVAGSVEERMLRLQERKKHLADTLLGSGGARAALTEHDVEDLFAPLEV